jgi:hypothetical protein
MNVQKGQIMKVYHDIIVQNQLDGFIMPPYQSTAQPHDLYGVPVYTVLANLLDVSRVCEVWRLALTELVSRGVKSISQCGQRA